jgi:hypothetical protein
MGNEAYSVSLRSPEAGSSLQEKKEAGTPYLQERTKLTGVEQTGTRPITGSRRRP